MTAGVPPLHRYLEPAVGPAPDGAVAAHRGPRRWWPGPLDVEGIALGSLQAVATALHRYPRPGPRFTVGSERAAAAFDSLGHLRIQGVAPQGFAPLSGFFRTRDGWVRLHGNYPHHARALRSVLAAETRDDVAAALLEREAPEVETAVRAAGGIAARVRTPREWAQSEAGAAVASGPWIRFTFGPSSAGGRAAGLDELRVLDLTRVVAGPSGTRLLGALGADVLRIDPPGMPELVDQHIDTGPAKRSALADLADPADLTRFRALLPRADVVVLGYRGAALDRFGLAPPSLLEAHPHLVVVTLDAWGDEGPWARQRGFDSVVQAATGVAHVYGQGEGDAFRPGALPVQALDHSTGYGLVAAALALLTRRATTGAGGWAHLSLSRTAHELLAVRAPSDVALTLPVPLRVTPSPYGELRHVPPALERAGEPLEYATAPERYGSSSLIWL